MNNIEYGNIPTLFKILKKYGEDTITTEILTEMGLGWIQGNVWWSNDCSAHYFSFTVTYRETVLDIVELIITLELISLEDSIAEAEAGEAW